MREYSEKPGERMRIVSLLPSATEIIAEIGLEDSLVGVTHECDFPPFVRDLPKVTRTHIPTDATSAEIDQLVRERLKADNALYTLDHETLERLQPDLIVTQALCDVCAVAEDEVREAACRLPGSPHVVNLEPMTLGGMFDAMREVADAARIVSIRLDAGLPARFSITDADQAFGRNDLRLNDIATRAETRTRYLEVQAGSLSRVSLHLKNRPRVVFLEWLEPPFSGGHWNPELVRLAGGIDVLGREGEPSRTLTWEEVREAEPDVIFIACCGFDMDRVIRDVAALASNTIWRNLRAVQAGRVFVADGSQYFNRPGPRLVDSLNILAHALHPELHPLPSHLPPARRVSNASIPSEN